MPLLFFIYFLFSFFFLPSNFFAMCQFVHRLLVCLKQARSHQSQLFSEIQRSPFIQIVYSPLSDGHLPPCPSPPLSSFTCNQISFNCNHDESFTLHYNIDRHNFNHLHRINVCWSYLTGSIGSTFLLREKSWTLGRVKFRNWRQLRKNGANFFLSTSTSTSFRQFDTNQSDSESWTCWMKIEDYNKSWLVDLGVNTERRTEFRTSS